MSSLLSLLVASFLASVNGDHTFAVDMSSTPTDVYPFWQSSTTEDHAYLALRKDWQDQLAATQKDLKLEFIRFHSIFDDSIGILNPRQPTTGNGKSQYSYVNVDKIYDALVSIGIKPLVELDFMPSLMVPNDKAHKSTMYNYPIWVGPPTNKTQWHNFVKSFVEHLVDRYGMETVSTWAFDAWNEPDCGHNWVDNNGDMVQTFEETWKETADAIKSVNKSFIVGAPGSACKLGDWLPDFANWCIKNDVGLDFFSAHMYPPKNTSDHDAYVKAMKDKESKIKAVSSKLKISNTAYGCTIESYGQSDHIVGPHDTSYNAACFSTFASQFQQLDRNRWFIWSFTGFTDLWDQQGIFSNEFHDGYGWMTNNGIKKPTYHALRLLVEYASGREYFNVTRKDSTESDTTLEVFVTQSKDGNEIGIFIMNWIDLGQHIIDETVIVNLDKIKSGKIIPSQGTIYRIDNDNCNPAGVWQKQGSPTYPTPKQYEEMVNASNTVANKISITNNNGDVTFKVDVPVYGVAVVVIDLS